MKHRPLHGNPRHGDRLGITIPEVLVIIAILALLLLLLLPAVQQTRESARRVGCVSNMRQFGMAVQNYESTHKKFPGCFSGWTEAVLPYMEHKQLFNRIVDFKEERITLDDLRSAAVPVYFCPSDPVAVDQKGWAPSYFMNDGYWPVENHYNGFLRVFEGVSLEDDWTKCRQTRPADIIDGLSNTAAIAEKLVVPPSSYFQQAGACSNNPQVWIRIIRETNMVRDLDEFARRCAEEPITPARSYFSEPSDLAFYGLHQYTHEVPPNRNSCTNGFHSGPAYFGATTATSLHPGGINLLFADGAVRFLSDSIDTHVWRALGSRNGREVVNF